jgi:quercetin dioxygenase-like cupin family protein
MTEPQVLVVPPGGGERFERSNRVVTILGAYEQLSVNEIEFEPSFDVSPHRHDDHVDSFFVLEGEVEFATADGPVRAVPGTFVAAPPGALHGFRTDGPGRARILNFHAPDAGFADSIRGH